MTDSTGPIEGSHHAWDILRANFRDDKGIIRPMDPKRKPTQREFEAIDHLCNEWDYVYEPSSKTP